MTHGPLSITFQLFGDAAEIQRATAKQLGLPVVDNMDATFTVLLHEPIDVWRLGTATADDPAWARVFLKRGGIARA